MRIPAAGLVLLGLPVLVLASCGGEDEDGPHASWPTEAERTLFADHAPTPFTAEQIKEACAPGRVSTYRFDEVGKEPCLQTFRFTEANEHQCRFEIHMTDLDGKPLRPDKTVGNTWSAFQRHASYPKDATTITNEEIALPGGTFHCFHYVVKGEQDGKPTVTDAWFAREVPGPPVKLSVTVDGTTRSTMTLVKHEPAPPNAP